MCSFETPNEACVTHCGHVYCISCILKWLNILPVSKGMCPVCKCYISRRSIFVATDVDITLDGENKQIAASLEEYDEKIEHEGALETDGQCYDSLRHTHTHHHCDTWQVLAELQPADQMKIMASINRNRPIKELLNFSKAILMILAVLYTVAFIRIYGMSKFKPRIENYN